MKNRSILATLSLALMQCGFDHGPTTFDPGAPVAVAAARAPDAPLGAWDDAAMQVLTHAGRRWVVVASGLSDDAGVGLPTIVENGYPVAVERVPRPTDVPAGWRAPRDVVLRGEDGSRCAVRTGALSVLSRFSSTEREDPYWEGGIDERVGRRVRDEALLREAWENGSGGRLLVAEVPAGGCVDAAWATDPAREVTAFTPSEPDARTRAAALAAFRATEPWAALQARFREGPTEDGQPVPADALWDAQRAPAAVRVWRAGAASRVFVTVRAEVPFEGCGAFSGDLWQVFERVGDRLVQRTAADVSAPADVTRAADVDGDGAPEFFNGHALLRLGPAGYQVLRSVGFPQHGCPC